MGLLVVLHNYNRSSKVYSCLLELDYVALVLILSDKTLLLVRRKIIELSKCRNEVSMYIYKYDQIIFRIELYSESHKE